MMLNSEQLKNLINQGKLDPKQIQQVSIDLKIAKIESLVSNGAILKDKTILPIYEELQISRNIVHDADGWYLEPGYYGFTFEEGVEVPANVGMLIIQRSSLLRNGITLTSSLWDPNFKTEAMGSFATVNNPVFLEKGARVACIYGWYCNEVPAELLYKGQYQGK